MTTFLSSMLVMLASWCFVAALATLPTWLIWNWLMPETFGLPSLGVIQTFALLLLCNFLVGSRPQLTFSTE